MITSQNEKFIQLNNHLKIWFGENLRETHVNRMIDQVRRNPSHSILLAVNREVLDNPKNKNLISRLTEKGILVRDINEITDKKNLEDQRLLYAINRMIKHGLENHAVKSFAAASDLARWLSSVVTYQCAPGEYRIYSDTD